MYLAYFGNSRRKEIIHSFTHTLRVWQAVFYGKRSEQWAGQYSPGLHHPAGNAEYQISNDCQPGSRRALCGCLSEGRPWVSSEVPMVYPASETVTYVLSHGSWAQAAFLADGTAPSILLQILSPAPLPSPPPCLSPSCPYRQDNGQMLGAGYVNCRNQAQRKPLGTAGSSLPVVPGREYEVVRWQVGGGSCPCCDRCLPLFGVQMREICASFSLGYPISSMVSWKRYRVAFQEWVIISLCCSGGDRQKAMFMFMLTTQVRKEVKNCLPVGCCRARHRLENSHCLIDIEEQRAQHSLSTAVS